MSCWGTQRQLCVADRDKLDGKYFTARYWRNKSNCIRVKERTFPLIICNTPLISHISIKYAAHSRLQPSDSSSGCVFVSSALIQALGDALFGVLGAGASGWNASANRSRAFSQFFWDLDLVIDMLSTDRVAPDPRPDWDVLIFSSICREKEERRQDRVFWF